MYIALNRIMLQTPFRLLVCCIHSVISFHCWFHNIYCICVALRRPDLSSIVCQCNGCCYDYCLISEILLLFEKQWACSECTFINSGPSPSNLYFLYCIRLLRFSSLYTNFVNIIRMRSVRDSAFICKPSVKIRTRTARSNHPGIQLNSCLKFAL